MIKLHCHEHLNCQDISFRNSKQKYHQQFQKQVTVFSLNEMKKNASITHIEIICQYKI